MISLTLPKSELAKFNRSINNLSKKGKQKINNEIQRSTLNVSHDAKSNAARSSSFLASKISPDIKKMEGTVTANSNYAPYVEFGTGNRVFITSKHNFTSEEKEYASQFKGKGLKAVNLPSRPFLFPAFFKERKEFLKRIQKIYK